MDEYFSNELWRAIGGSSVLLLHRYFSVEENFIRASTRIYIYFFSFFACNWVISFNIRRNSHGWQSISKSFEIRRRSLIWQAELPLGHGLKVPWKTYLKSRGIQWNCFLRDRSYAPLAFQPSLVIAIQIKSPWPADKAILVSVISSREFRCCIAIGKKFCESSLWRFTCCLSPVPFIENLVKWII